MISLSRMMAPELSEARHEAGPPWLRSATPALLLLACSGGDLAMSQDPEPPAGPIPESVILTPPAATLTPGERRQFTAAIRMSDGTVVAARVTYGATGGRVSADGLYAADSTEGTYRVIGSLQDGVLADTAGVVISALDPDPSATLLLEDAFEGFGEWGRREFCCSHSQTIADTLAREGSTAALFTLRRSDPPASCFRCVNIDQALRPRLKGWDRDSNGPFRAGDEVWFGFSVYIPNDWIDEGVPPFHEILVEVHDTPDNKPGTNEPDWSVAKTAFLYLLAERGNFVWVSRWDDCAYGSRCWKPFGVERRPYVGPLRKGGWTDFVVHAKWSFGQDGLLEIWRDAQLVALQTGPNAYNQENPGFFKLGLYKWSWRNTDIKLRTVLYDAVRIGSGNAGYPAVAPR